MSHYIRTELHPRRARFPAPYIASIGDIARARLASGNVVRQQKDPD